MKIPLNWIAAAALAALLAGCATTVEYGDATSSKPISTSFGSSDLQQIAAAMVDSMLADEVLQAQGPHGAVQHLVLAGGRRPQEPSAGGRHGHGAGPTSRPPGGGTVTAQAPVRSRWAGPGWTAARRG